MRDGVTHSSQLEPQQLLRQPKWLKAAADVAHSGYVGGRISVLLGLVGCVGACADSSEAGVSYDVSSISADSVSDVPAVVDAASPVDTAAPADLGPPDDDTQWPPCDAGDEPGCPCEENADCSSGYCVATADGKVCTETCLSSCPDGWSCTQITNTGTDLTFICVPKYTELCRPCETGADCAQLGDLGGYCLERDDGQGSFCSGDCSPDEPCPQGYDCKEVVAAGEPVLSCVPVAGECACSVKAVKEGAHTSCAVTNRWGTCSGMRSCGADGLSACDAQTPGQEVCDGVDNDCNGVADDDFPDTDADGTLDCLDDDDDADGDVDAVDCAPLNEAIHSQADELCDGVDNNCNDEVDEGLGETSCGDGICATTAPNCLFGKPNPCLPLIEPGVVTEVCDGLDNDCDGAVDEELGKTTCGAGACEHVIDNCADGQPQFCDPFEGGAPSETCDGKDNDCDGEIDEDLGVSPCGKGVCAHTVQNCVDGAPQPCDPFLGNGSETCDGLDNDCDGKTDEDLGATTCGKGVCTHTVQNCLAGETGSCDPMAGSGVEVCDGADNNCDGQTDEALGETTCGQGP